MSRPNAPKETFFSEENPAPGFSERLERLLMDKEMTQEGLGEASGLSRKSINRYCNGSVPRAKTIRRLAEALGVPVEALVFDVHVEGAGGPDAGDASAGGTTAAEGGGKIGADIGDEIDRERPKGPTRFGEGVSMHVDHVMTELRDELGTALAVVVQVYVRDATRQMSLASGSVSSGRRAAA